MILELPFSNDAAQAFTVQLGDGKYYIESRYNSRNGVWTMDLSDDATRTALVKGLAIVLGQDLLAPYNFGIGSLVAVDSSGQGLDATAEDFGDRVSLYWTSPDETFEDTA